MSVWRNICVKKDNIRQLLKNRTADDAVRFVYCRDLFMVSTPAFGRFAIQVFRSFQEFYREILCVCYSFLQNPT